jgi:hypothetical protein
MSISRFSVDLVVTELAVIAFPGARDPRRNRAWCSQVIAATEAPLTVPQTVPTTPT